VTAEETLKGDRPLKEGENRHEWTEVVKCAGCGYPKRTRCVRWSGSVSYRKLCTPCEFERSARVHEDAAQRLRTKAAQMRTRRARRKGTVE
jgi:ribosomal protein L37E